MSYCLREIIVSYWTALSKVRSPLFRLVAKQLNLYSALYELLICKALSYGLRVTRRSQVLPATHT